jgi:hypothetical protein
MSLYTRKKTNLYTSKDAENPMSEMQDVTKDRSCNGDVSKYSFGWRKNGGQYPT